ncbi:hypothetical protein KMZ93_03810 [Bradyrhizobium sediminis]|uniref:DUF541 domain-containing protein n=1 Tax=Bradyrhizobium sediminis TaxID=2840469 RepID=A0A975NZZ4_9BRAD|nr:hypothetical protein [Bradyrhizobium sediminis]QWG24065.1 hypothetical protein KMZ93_03810 [Bradyrhizobium sediminis]
MLRTLFVVLCLVFGAHIGWAQDVRLVGSATTDFDPKVTYDEVYGYVKYTVKEPKLARKDTSYNPFEKLIEAAKDLLGDSETASLTIALEIYSGDQRLAREPLLVQQWNEKGVFFLQNSREEIRQLKQSRVIVDYLPVSAATNRLTVKVAAYVNADSVFDLKTLQKLTALERLILKTNPVELSEHSKAVFAATEDFLNSVFGKHQKGTSELSTEMAFIGQGAAGAGKRRSFELSGVAQVDGETYQIRLPVEIEFGTHPTKRKVREQEIWRIYAQVKRL